MGCICPVWPCLCLTVMVEGVEEDRRLELCMQFGSSDGWGHPLMVSEKSQQGLPTHVAVVSVSPVGIHELYGLPQDVLTWAEATSSTLPGGTHLYIIICCGQR